MGLVHKLVSVCYWLVFAFAFDLGFWVRLLFCFASVLLFVWLFDVPYVLADLPLIVAVLVNLVI